MNRIAVIGTGIAGLGAAYEIARSGREIELFEAASAPGGHTRTDRVGSLALDSGFIVHNSPNYPLLTRLFADLGVRTQPSEMSFSVECACGVSWSSRRPWQAGRRLLSEIVRFLRTAGDAPTDGATLDELLRNEGYTDAFRWHYLVPMVSAIWSAPPGHALEMPAAGALGFFERHGLLGLRRHRWRTVAGGSQTYVRALLERIDGRVHTGLPVRAISRSADDVTLATDDGERRGFDGVVVATDAPRALELLDDPSPDEARLLGAFRTTANEAVLHTDQRLLPRRDASRASWNYRSPGCGVLAPLPTVTYSLNRLQRLSTPDEYCVTLNATDRIDPSRIIAVYRDLHPQPTFESLAARPELHRLNGRRRTALAGAWQGDGFHEDGLASGLRAGRAIVAALR